MQAMAYHQQQQFMLQQADPRQQAAFQPTM
jgi:hypothetical protein